MGIVSAERPPKNYPGLAIMISIGKLRCNRFANSNRSREFECSCVKLLHTTLNQRLSSIGHRAI